MTTQNRYLELQQYNNLTRNTAAIMTFNGTNFLDTQTQVWPFKFHLNSRNFPLYIPTIVDTFVPHNIDSATETVLEQNDQHFMIDWAITIEMADNTTKTTPVYWRKDGFRPTMFDENNSYFWIKSSDEICTYITKAFETLTGKPEEVYFIKNADRWCLLVEESSPIKKVYFNKNMAKFFDFNYTNNKGKIDIIDLNTFGIKDKVYSNIVTATTNNKLFPFTKLVFKSTLRVPQLNMQFNTQVKNYSDQIILSYDLIIDDINEIGNSLHFVSDCKDRSLSLMAFSTLDTFTVTPYFVTRDGDLFDIHLEPEDSCSISMMFF